MIDLQVKKNGTLTAITAICPSEIVADQVRQIMRAATSRFTTRPGLTVSVACNRREAGRIQTQIRAMIEASMVGSGHAESAPAATRIWRHRETYPADAPISCIPHTITIGGETYHLSGMGREFIGREIDGPYWRLPVRYAYYT